MSIKLIGPHQLYVITKFLQNSMKFHLNQTFNCLSPKFEWEVGGVTFFPHHRLKNFHTQLRSFCKSFYSLYRLPRFPPAWSERIIAQGRSLFYRAISREGMFSRYLRGNRAKRSWDILYFAPNDKNQDGGGNKESDK